MRNWRIECVRNVPARSGHDLTLSLTHGVSRIRPLSLSNSRNIHLAIPVDFYCVRDLIAGNVKEMEKSLKHKKGDTIRVIDEFLRSEDSIVGVILFFQRMFVFRKSANQRY